ncbi:MAG: DUF5693 family protein [Limnochordia bacterium]|nr:DUF5693 family protein [Limnochordia bacterium]
MAKTPYFVLILAILCSSMILFQRWEVERGCDTVLIAVDYGDLVQVGLDAPQTPGVVLGLDLREGSVSAPEKIGVVVVDDQSFDSLVQVDADLVVSTGSKAMGKSKLWGVLEFQIPQGISGIPLRVHQIPRELLTGYDLQRACDRLLLGVRERGISVIYLNLFTHMPDPKAYNQAYIDELTSRLTQAGFKLGYPKPLAVFHPSLPLVVVTGMGVWCIVYLLLASLGMQASILIPCGFVLSTVLAYQCGGDDLVRQVFALVVTLSFPVYALVSGYRVITKNRGKTTNTVALYLRACGQVILVTCLGVVFIGALLADAKFMLGLTGFRGVKLSAALPPLVVFLLFFKKQERVTLRWYLVVPVGIAFLYYVLRTGTGLAPILNLERQIRAILEHLLVVRPRFKEFLVGYPALFVGYYRLLRKERYPSALLIAMGTLAPVSVLNSFCHAHTPLQISIQRSALGLLLGIVVVVILGVLWKVLGAGEKNVKGYFGGLLRL